MKKYITIADPNGATRGYGGPFVSISHSVLYDGKAFYGWESIQKFFPKHQAMVDFLVNTVAHPVGATGAFGALTWQISDQPVTSYQSGSVEVLTNSK
jgi:hypothetical protein